MNRRFEEFARMTMPTKVAVGAALGLAVLAGPAFAQAPGPFPETSGKEVYEAICQSCHMPDGKGSQGAGAALIGYPAVAANPKMASAAYPAMVVVRGLRAMPQFGSQLNDEQVANVVNYIRTEFGNNYANPMTPAQVTPLRPARAAAVNARPPG